MFRIFRRRSNESPVPVISARELKRLLDGGENVLVLDVRQPTGYDAYPGTIPGAVRIPPAMLPERYQELPRDRPIVLFCT